MSTAFCILTLRILDVSVDIKTEFLSQTALKSKVSLESRDVNA